MRRCLVRAKYLSAPAVALSILRGAIGLILTRTLNVHLYIYLFMDRNMQQKKVSHRQNRPLHRGSQSGATACVEMRWRLAPLKDLGKRGMQPPVGYRGLESVFRRKWFPEQTI